LSAKRKFIDADYVAAAFRRAAFSSHRRAKSAGLKAAATTSTAILRLPPRQARTLDNDGFVAAAFLPRGTKGRRTAFSPHPSPKRRQAASLQMRPASMECGSLLPLSSPNRIAVSRTRRGAACCAPEAPPRNPATPPFFRGRRLPLVAGLPDRQAPAPTKSVHVLQGVGASAPTKKTSARSAFLSRRSSRELSFSLRLAISRARILNDL
jgi:hypothetical protein